MTHLQILIDNQEADLEKLADRFEDFFLRQTASDGIPAAEAVATQMREMFIRFFKNYG